MKSRLLQSGKTPEFSTGLMNRVEQSFTEFYRVLQSCELLIWQRPVTVAHSGHRHLAPVNVRRLNSPVHQAKRVRSEFDSNTVLVCETFAFRRLHERIGLFAVDAAWRVSSRELEAPASEVGFGNEFVRSE